MQGKQTYDVTKMDSYKLMQIVSGTKCGALTKAMARLELARRAAGCDFNATIMNYNSYGLATVTSYNGEMAAMTDAGVVIITKEQAKAFFNLIEA